MTVTRVVQGFAPDGRPLPARAGDGAEIEREQQRTREHQEQQRAQAEAAQEAQRQWARRRDELREALAARERVRDDLSSGGPSVLSPEDLAEVQRIAYLAGAEALTEAARVAITEHERRQP